MAPSSTRIARWRRRSGAVPDGAAKRAHLAPHDRATWPDGSNEHAHCPCAPTIAHPAQRRTRAQTIPNCATDPNRCPTAPRSARLAQWHNRSRDLPNGTNTRDLPISTHGTPCPMAPSFASHAHIEYDGRAPRPLVQTITRTAHDAQANTRLAHLAQSTARHHNWRH
jgi:hypothetical protein